MTVEELLPRLRAARRTSRGYLAQCPAHADKSPSLSVSAGERGILLKCFAACTASDIVSALGLTLADLFTDGPLPRGQRPSLKPPKLDRRQVAFTFELHALALQERAQAVLASASGLDCTSWNGDDFDKAVEAVGQAHDDLKRAETLFSVADSQRERTYREGR